MVDFYRSNLENARLKNSNLTGSYLSECNIRGTQFDWSNMSDVLIDNVQFNNKTSFIGVKLSNIDFNLSELLQDFALGQQRIVNLERKYPVLAAFLRITCDYGRSFSRFLAWCAIVISVFGLAYYLVPSSIVKTNSATSVTLWDSLYFSIMTFTSAGSDIVTNSAIGRIVAVAESVVGYLMTGLLVAILVKRTIGD
jgi:hypothetical protein